MKRDRKSSTPDHSSFACPKCGSKNKEQFGKGYDLKYGFSGFSHYTCVDCGFQFDVVRVAQKRK
jgi:transposase-like protein